jgi:hypothetical protein
MIPICIFAMHDSSGFFGELIHYLLLFLIMGITLLLFFYLYKQVRFSFDEKSKLQLFQEDESEHDPK